MVMLCVCMCACSRARVRVCMHMCLCVYLVCGSEGPVGKQGSVVDGVGSVVEQDGAVLHLQHLDALPHHRRHAELTQLGVGNSNAEGQSVEEFR